MYCSHCGKKVGEDMLFCPFCGKPIVIPEQDDAPAAVPAFDEPVLPTEGGSGKAETVLEPETDGPEAKPLSVDDRSTSVLNDAGAPGDGSEAPTVDEAAAELLDWSQTRRHHMEADVWARPDFPSEDFSPLTLEGTKEQPQEAAWKEEITRKKQSVTLEKKPPEMKRGDESPVRLDGNAPKLDLDVQDEKPRAKGQKHRKHANTLVPPKTMDPEDIFMDDRRAAYDEDDPYDYDDRDDESDGRFSFEDEDEGSFFMRHLRGIVGLALFAILLLLIVIFAFSRAGQLSLARANVAWSKDAYSTLGYQYFQAGDYSQAGRFYERALQRDPDSYSFASSAAMAYLEAGDNENAAAMLKRCAQIDPVKLEPYVYLLKLYPDAASRPWDVTQLLQQGYQQTGDARLNVTG